MKTRLNEQSAQTGLPPPPAPPAHDANPWPMSSPGPAVDPALPPRRRPLGAAPLLVLVFLAATGVRLAIHAWRDQDYAGMFAALAILSMVAFMVWRRSRSRR